MILFVLCIIKDEVSPLPAATWRIENPNDSKRPNNKVGYLGTLGNCDIQNISSSGNGVLIKILYSFFQRAGLQMSPKWPFRDSKVAMQ